jgi:ribosomal protein L16 Arg81 hydroxylase
VTDAPGGPDALARALDPVRPADFLAEYLEQRPLVLSRGGSASFDDLLSVADIDWLIAARIRTPAFRLVKHDGSVRDYTEDIPWRPGVLSGTARPDRVRAEFERGATIVLQALHLNWPALARYCRMLEAQLERRVQANAYYSPPRAQGFGVHHDTHDVFILQVAGAKRWLVYEPRLQLPLPHQRWTDALGGPGELIHDLTLEPGDTLYLPRGFAHEARTSDTSSLHLTVGLHSHTWTDAIRAALDACAGDVEFRRSVPADGTPPPELLERLAARLAPEAVAERRRRRFVTSRRPVLDDGLAQSSALPALTVRHELERRSTVIADRRDTADGVTLAFEGKEVLLPAKARSEVDGILDADGPFRLADLPGAVDDAGRLVLGRRLVREGFLRMLDPRPL